MSNEKTTQAVLLVNLGSPDSCEVKDVKTYLKQFLLDPYVIDGPWLFRQLLVRGIILNTRPKKSAEAYRSIWTKEGSPLVISATKQRDLLREQVEFPVEIGMRYGNPSIESGFQALVDQYPDLETVFMLPLYPHYAMASTRTVVEEAQRVVAANNWSFKLQIQSSFFDEEKYIEILAQSIASYVKTDFDHLLFSYHGIPVRHLKKQDPTGTHCYKVKDCCHQPSAAHATCYKHQVTVTTEKVVAKLGIPKDKWSISFQSRLGVDEWIAPFTDKELERLPKEGKKRLLIVSPAFISDCLETIEELGEEGEEIFMENGGESYTLIPCLNESPGLISFLRYLCEKQLQAVSL